MERLEAEGIAATTSSKRNQSVAARNTHGADLGGSSSSEFLTGNLKLHLDSLAYGPFCEYSCSEYLHHILSPTCASEQHAQKHASWEGPGRALLGPQLYASGPGWLQPFHRAGFLPYFQYPWGTRGVELSPRPRGTGTYHPNTVSILPRELNVRMPFAELQISAVVAGSLMSAVAILDVIG